MPQSPRMGTVDGTDGPRHLMAVFIQLIIHFFSLFFLHKTVFFSRNKSANSIFLAGLSAQPNEANAAFGHVA
jgi:hypothetical protein